MDRRRFLNAASLSLAGGMLTHAAACAPSKQASRLRAMLLGSLIGDAMGGPIEFKPPEQIAEIMPAARTWDDDRRLNQDDMSRLAESLRLFSYAKLRPDTAAYGPWMERAAAGTITDDSRHKIVLMRALRQMRSEGRNGLRREDLAKAFLSFTPVEGAPVTGQLARLVEEGLREYRMASRWILGERDLKQALPIERLWAGVSNCSGQMALLPMAGVFPGQPERAYRETFRLNFIDAPIARDIVSAMNAGLAAVLNPATDGMSAQARWDLLLKTMHQTDPYRFAEVPFAWRQLHRWLDLANSIAQRSEGRPKVAYQLLEDEGKPVYFWDAHFTLLVPLTLLRLCEFEPLAAFHLALDFGHDTDSYAQVLGALAGAVHGMDIWNKELSMAVESRLAADFGESIDDWTDLLAASATSWTDFSDS